MSDYCAAHKELALGEQMSQYETQKLRLEERKIAAEERKLEIEHSFFHKHVGLFITAVLSLAAVLVSGSQVWVANINKNKELELSQQQREKELEQKTMENERRWKLDGLKFVMSNQELIFSEDLDQRRRIRDIMVATLPEEITLPLFRRLAALSAPDERSIWNEGRQELYESILDSLIHELDWDATVEGPPEGRQLVLRYKKRVPQGKEPSEIDVRIVAEGKRSDGKSHILPALTFKEFIEERSELGGKVVLRDVMRKLEHMSDAFQFSLSSLDIRLIYTMEDGFNSEVVRLSVALP